jgi:hypothetical protein
MSVAGLSKLVDALRAGAVKPLGMSVTPKYYMGESFMPSRFIEGYGNVSAWQEIYEVKDLEEFLAITNSMNGAVELDGWIYVYVDDFDFGGSGAPCKAVRERVNARANWNYVDEEILSQMQSRKKLMKSGRKFSKRTRRFLAKLRDEARRRGC